MNQPTPRRVLLNELPALVGTTLGRAECAAGLSRDEYGCVKESLSDLLSQTRSQFVDGRRSERSQILGNTRIEGRLCQQGLDMLACDERAAHRLGWDEICHRSSVDRNPEPLAGFNLTQHASEVVTELALRNGSQAAILANLLRAACAEWPPDLQGCSAHRVAESAGTRRSFLLQSACVVQGCYLLHFDRPIHGAQHYLGWATNVARRVAIHNRGRGARLVAQALSAGIRVDLVRVWPDVDQAKERALKRNGPKSYCPKCTLRREQVLPARR